MQRALQQRGIGRADIQPAGDVQQGFAEIAFQAAPTFVGTLQQRHVEGPFGIGEADDARFAVRRTVGVRDVVLLQPEHPRATLSERVTGGAAHAADANDDHIIMIGRTFVRRTTVRSHASLRCCLLLTQVPF